MRKNYKAAKGRRQTKQTQTTVRYAPAETLTSVIFLQQRKLQKATKGKLQGDEGSLAKTGLPLEINLKHIFTST